jgi:hypothetical protein
MTSSEWASSRQEIERSSYWISPNGRRPRWTKKIFNFLLATFGATLRLAGLHGKGRRNALDLQLRRHELHLPHLPTAFDGYRLLHVSDSHLDVVPELAERAHALLDGLEVDLLVFTGDALGDAGASIGHAADLLASAVRGVSARDGRLAILGNHDPAEMVGDLQRVGFEVLVNRTLDITRGADRIRLTGLDDVHSFYTPEAQAALEPMHGDFAMALVHSAELADHAAAAGYSLYLSGHTHAGQIALPGGRPLTTQLVRCRHLSAGLWRHEALVGHTSSGLGVSRPPVRFNTRGEAALLTLRRTGTESA